MSIEALYHRRIGIQPRSWTPESNPTPVRPPGVHVADPGARAGTALRRGRSTSFLDPAPGALPRGSSWCSSEDALTLRIQQATSWASWLSSLNTDDTLLVERDLAAKLTLQRGGAYGWDVFPDGLGLPPAGSIEDAARLIGEYIVTHSPRIPARWTPVPRGTNSGCPTYGTSDADKLLHALMAAQTTTWSSAERVYARYREQFEAIHPIHAIVFSRTGPVRKGVPIYDWLGGELAHIATGVSVVPRRRAVFGVPAFINMALQGHANVAKYAVMRLPWTAHPNERVIFEDMEHVLTTSRGSEVFSDDISGFDQHVRREHQEAIARHVYALLWPPTAVELWLEAQRMPVLNAPLDASQRAFLYTRPQGGVTTSGIITTSLDGTLINLARAVTAYAHAQHQSIRQAWNDLLARRWYIKAWGDDTVMIVPSGFDHDRYQEANDQIGYTTTPVSGATFLMKRYDFSRRTVYPLATRVFQQTVWNEKGGRTPEIELLGLFVRTGGFERNPYWRDCWELITERVDVLDLYGIKTRLQLGSIIQDPGFLNRLHAGIRANPSTVSEWLARSDRGHVEDRELLSWLGALLGASLEDAAKLDLTGALSTAVPEAARLASTLAKYLGTPVDERREAPSWIEAMLATPTIDEDDTTTEHDDDQQEKGE